MRLQIAKKLQSSSHLLQIAIRINGTLLSARHSSTVSAENDLQALYLQNSFDEAKKFSIDFQSKSKQVHSLCKKGKVAEAIQLLENLQSLGYKPDGCNLNSIIHAFCASGRFPEAHCFVSSALSSSWIPDERTCNIILGRLCDAQMPMETLAVMKQMISLKQGYVPAIFNYNKLIHSFCKQGRLKNAKKLMDEMKERGCSPNVVSYTSLINGLCKTKSFDAAWQLFEEMRSRVSPCLPNSLTYSIVIMSLFTDRKVAEGRELMAELWSQMACSDTDSNLAAFSNLIRGLCRGSYLSDILCIASVMPQGNSVPFSFAYALLIDVLSEFGFVDGAARVVYMMKKRGFIPDSVSYNTVVHSLCVKGRIEETEKMIHEAIENGYTPSEPTYEILVESFCKAGKLDKARDLLDLMLIRSSLDTSRIYNIFMYAVSTMFNPNELLNTMIRMLQNGCTPDLFTLNTVISGFCKVGQVNEAKTILNDMMEGKFCAPDAITFSTIIYGLSGIGSTDEALQVLDHMKEVGYRPTVQTYNPIIRGLCKSGNIDKAFEIIRKMRSSGLNPDKITYMFIIDGLGKAGQSNKALEYWHSVVKASQNHDDLLYSSLLRSLCKCGKLIEAWDLLDQLIKDGFNPGILSYNVLMDAVCKLGTINDAFKILEKMKENNLSPDVITWRMLNRLHQGHHKKDKLLTPRENKPREERIQTLSEFVQTLLGITF